VRYRTYEGLGLSRRAWTGLLACLALGYGPRGPYPCTAAPSGNVNGARAPLTGLNGPEQAHRVRVLGPVGPCGPFSHGAGQGVLKGDQRGGVSPATLGAVPKRC